jgi:succinate-acetate transporter protein
MTNKSKLGILIIVLIGALVIGDMTNQWALDKWEGIFGILMVLIAAHLIIESDV